jgi:hypothetical protein
MKAMILIMVAMLYGCSTTVPVKQRWPDAPLELMKKCPTLVQLAPTETAITDLLRVVVRNYTTYYECSTRLEGWQEWYDTQKKIFEEVNK